MVSLNRGWLGVVVSALTLLGVVGISAALRVRDQVYVQRQVQSEAERLARTVGSQFEAATRGVERLGEQWINRAGMTEVEWGVEAQATLRDVPGLSRLAMASRRKVLQWMVPVGGDRPGPRTRSLDSLPVLDTALTTALIRRRTILLAGDGGLLPEQPATIVVPLCYLAQCDGFFLGAVDPQRLLQSIKEAIPEGYQVALLRGGTAVAHLTDPGAGPPPADTVRSDVAPSALGWSLVVMPTEAALAAIRSRIPAIVLYTGSAIALLLGLSFWLAGASEQHRREAESQRQVVEESERRFRATFDSAFQLVWLLDRNGTLLQANRTALDVLGGVEGNGAGGARALPLWETGWWAGNALRQARLEAACSEALAGGVVRYEETVPIRSLGAERAEEIVLDLSVKAIRGADGKVEQLLTEGRDITQRRRAEAAIKELETLSSMGRLAARVAHEINNPLAGIRNSFLLLRDAVPADHPQYVFVGAIEREIDRIATVTRQLYETYRPDQEQRRACAVATVLADVTALLRQVNREREVTMQVDTHDLPGSVPVPEAIVRQAAYNLIQNAVEASPVGGTVEIVARLEGPAGAATFVLTVRDAGDGVPAADRERIFEPFFSTKTGLTTGGMGLGLSLVKRSVEALGGVILVWDAPSGGAEFVIRIPLATEPQRETTA